MKPNCSFCSFSEIEIKRTENVFNDIQSDSKKNNITFYSIDCSLYENTCLSFGCHNVPTIILSDKKGKKIFRYADEKTALCERLTSFIIEKANIRPKNQYFLEKLDEVMNETNLRQYDKDIQRMYINHNEINIVNFTYVHQANDINDVRTVASTGRCVALSFPILGMIPYYTRIIFDYFYKNDDFYPIVIKNKNSYKIERYYNLPIDILLFTSHGVLPIFLNNTLQNIIDQINYACFINGHRKVRKFVEMIVSTEQSAALSMIENELLKFKSKNAVNNDNSLDGFFLSYNFDQQSSQVDAKTAKQVDKSTSDSSNFNSKNVNQFELPYEFRYFAEDPEKLIAFTKMMFLQSFEYVVRSISQLRKTVLNEKTSQFTKAKLSQRLMILKIIKEMLLEEKLNQNGYF